LDNGYGLDIAIATSLAMAWIVVAVASVAWIVAAGSAGSLAWIMAMAWIVVAAASLAMAWIVAAALLAWIVVAVALLAWIIAALAKEAAADVADVADIGYGFVGRLDNSSGYDSCLLKVRCGSAFINCGSSVGCGGFQNKIENSEWYRYSVQNNEQYAVHCRAYKYRHVQTT
jgi:hypothetical protein